MNELLINSYEYKDWQLKRIESAKKLGIDITPYIVQGFDQMQIGIIGQGLMTGVDVSKYARLDLSCSEMEAILTVLLAEEVSNGRFIN